MNLSKHARQQARTVNRHFANLLSFAADKFLYKYARTNLIN